MLSLAVIIFCSGFIAGSVFGPMSSRFSRRRAGACNRCTMLASGPIYKPIPEEKASVMAASRARLHMAKLDELQAEVALARDQPERAASLRGEAAEMRHDVDADLWALSIREVLGIEPP